MKRLVLFVEGEGESLAAPLLISRLLTEIGAWNVLQLDPHPFRVGQVNRLLKNDGAEWKRKLQAANKRPEVGGVLLLLDGDVKQLAGGAPFCSAMVARSMIQQAKEVGAGELYSVAVVFARQEFESWLIAGIDSLAGKALPDGRTIAPPDKLPPVGNLEESPRNAKAWLGRVIDGGYKPTRDQLELTRLVDLAAVRQANPRSFRRLESALGQLVGALRSDRHVASPAAE